MASILGKESSEAVVRPPHDINPESKDQQWHLDFCKFIYHTGREETANKKRRADYLRSYAEGRQDPGFYRQLLGYGDDTDAPAIPIVRTDDEGEYTHEQIGTTNATGEKYMDTNDEEIFSPAPKFLMVLSGIMEGEDHSVVVKAINEYALREKDQKKMAMWYEMKYGQWERQQLQKAGMEVPTQDEFVPSDIHELKIIEDSGHLRLPYEIALEKGIEDYKEISDSEEQYRSFMRDLFTLNDGAIHDYYDDDIGKCRFKRVDPATLYIEPVQDHDHKKVTWQGYPSFVTIVDLRNATGWDEEKIHSLATSFTGKHGNLNSLLDSIDQFGEHGTSNYDDFLIPIMNCFWKTTDTRYYQKRTLKSTGFDKEFEEPWRSKTRPPKQKRSEKREMFREDIRNVRECKWVIGSDECYDWGVMDELPFDYGERDTPLPIFRVTIPGKPIVENMVPMLDQLQLSFLKWQNNLAKAAPPGLAIELSSFMNLSFDNKEWEVLDIIKLRQQTGTLIYKLESNNVPGSPSGQSMLPYAEIKGGVELASSEFVTSAEIIYSQLAEVTGVDRFSSASKTPEARQAVGVTQMVQAATINTLKPYYAKWITIQKMIYASAGNRIQHIVALNKGRWDWGYLPTMGNNLYKILQIASTKNPVVMGISIRPAPTQEMKAAIVDAAGAALKSGGDGIQAITSSEYLFIIKELMFNVSFNNVIAIIRNREKVAEEKRAAMQEKLPVIQAEEQRKSDAMKAEQKINEKKADAELVLVKGEEDRKLEQVKHNNKLVQMNFEFQSQKQLQILSNAQQSAQNTQNNGNSNEKANK